MTRIKTNRQGPLGTRFVATAAALAITLSACSLVGSASSGNGFITPSFAPADTTFFSVLTMRPSLGQAAAATLLMNAFTTQPGFDAAFANLGSGWQGVDPQNDVLPLLDGEIAVAGVAGPNGSSSSIGFVHATDPGKLLTWQATQDGNGMPPTTQSGPQGTVLYLNGYGLIVGAVDGPWALVSDDEDLLNDVIGRIAAQGQGQGHDGLAAQTRYQSIVQTLPTDVLGVTYVDLSAYGRQQPTIQYSSPLPADEQAQLQNLGVAALSIAAVPGGLDLRSESRPDAPMALPAANFGDSGNGFDHLPATALVGYAGTSLPRLLAPFRAALQQALGGSSGPFGNLDLHPENWLAGDFGIGVEGSASNPDQPELYGVAQVTNVDAAQADLDALQQALPNQTLQTIQVAGQDFLQLPPTRRDPGFTYGIADSWLYATTGDAARLVAAHESGGLTGNPRFKLVNSVYANDRDGVFLDLQGIREFAEGQLTSSKDVSDYSATIQPFLVPLRAVGSSWLLDDSGSTHGRTFIAIQG